MTKEMPFIHAFKTRGGYYVYDVNRNQILKLEKNVYEALRTNNLKTSDTEVDLAIQQLKKDGFLSDKRTKKIKHPMDDAIEYLLDRRLRMLTLQVTQQCNLRCKYCVYSGEGEYENRSHSNKKMDFELAKKGIDFLVEHSFDSDTVALGFYGGEPLLEFELIKKCTYYIKEKAKGKEIQLSLTTNGTLFTDEIVSFFLEHDFSVLISLDGPRDLHDKNRRFAGSGKGTFDKIMSNIDTLKVKFPEFYKKITFNTVLDPENDFGCINDFFMNSETIKNSHKNITPLSDKYIENPKQPTEDFKTNLSYEIFKTMLSGIGRLDKKYLSGLTLKYMELLRMFYHEERKPTEALLDIMHPGGPCLAGVTRLFMNVDGTFYPCERVSENSHIMQIGHVDTGFDVDKCREILNIGNITENECKNCWAFRFCSLCAAAADDLNGLSSEKKKRACNWVKGDTEYSFKDYCTVKEFLADFGDDEKYLQNIYTNSIKGR